MLKPFETRRKYFAISEVAEEIGETTSCIRWWESKFPEIRPKKTEVGRGMKPERRYTEDEKALIKEVHRLLREEYLTIKGVRKRLFNG